jgi:hypothetical protein
MEKSHISISALESEDLPSQSQTVDEEQIEMFAQSPSVSQTSSASKSSENTGPKSPSTMMSKASRKTSAKSMSSQAGIHVSPSVKLGSAKARQMTVTSGRGCLKSLSKQDPAYAFLKMLLVTSAWESTRCYLTWQLKVTMRGRSYLELSVKTHRTGDNEFLSSAPNWPTPTASDVEGGIVQNVDYENGSFSRKNKEGVRWGVKLRDAVNHAEKMWGGEKVKGQLSADWVEILQGYPRGWTEIGNEESQE